MIEQKKILAEDTINSTKKNVRKDIAKKIIEKPNVQNLIMNSINNTEYAEIENKIKNFIEYKIIKQGFISNKNNNKNNNKIIVDIKKTRDAANMLIELVDKYKNELIYTVNNQLKLSSNVKSFLFDILGKKSELISDILLSQIYVCNKSNNIKKLFTHSNPSGIIKLKKEDLINSKNKELFIILFYIFIISIRNLQKMNTLKNMNQIVKTTEPKIK